MGGSPVINCTGNPILVASEAGVPYSYDLSGGTSSFVLTASTTPIIQYVFVLMLENHSFDNVFAFSGIPGITAATTADSNTANGMTYNVSEDAPSSMPYDPNHEFPNVVTQLCGEGVTYTPGTVYATPVNNSGFAADYQTTGATGLGDIMACFNTQTQLPVIYTLATQFALCDSWHSSIPGPPWPNRYFVHGASSAGLDHSPSAEQTIEWEGTEILPAVVKPVLKPILKQFGGFHYPNGSIYDSLNNANLAWHLYQDTYTASAEDTAGLIPQSLSIHNIHIDNFSAIGKFASDLGGGYKPCYTFIEPSYGADFSTYEGGSSQHPMDGMTHGEALIQTVYGAIRNSPLWSRSLLIVTYDEHGGFYDSVSPGTTVAPGDGPYSPSLNSYGFTFEQLGIRVPAVIVSPWIGQGVVDHTLYDHSSVPATLESLFGMPHLTARDAQANNVLHLLTGNYRSDCPASLPNPAQITEAAPSPEEIEARTARTDAEPMPATGNIWGFLANAARAEAQMAGGLPEHYSAAFAKVRAIKTRGEARQYLREIGARVRARWQA